MFFNSAGDVISLYPSISGDLIIIYNDYRTAKRSNIIVNGIVVLVGAYFPRFGNNAALIFNEAKKGRLKEN